jgi:hypothetical protein
MTWAMRTHLVRSDSLEGADLLYFAGEEHFADGTFVEGWVRHRHGAVRLSPETADWTARTKVAALDRRNSIEIA